MRSSQDDRAHFTVTEVTDGPVEREGTIDDRLHPAQGDGPIHCDELGPTASNNDSECCNPWCSPSWLSVDLIFRRSSFGTSLPVTSTAERSSQSRTSRNYHE